MRKFYFIIAFALSSLLFAVYQEGDYISSEDNISWRDNSGYISSIYKEVFSGTPVVLFFGKKTGG